MYRTGFTRHLMNNGKRKNKGITKYGKCKTLADRLIMEAKALNDYIKRVGNQKPSTKTFI